MNELISIVIPVYNDKAVISELLDRLIPAISSINKYYEVIFVEDGSTDESYSLLKNFIESNNRLRLIKLSRNFGQQNAISAGLNNALGDIVVIMDSDLQDRPEYIKELITKMHADNVDMVIAKWISRDDTFVKKKLSKLFNNITNRITEICFEKDLGVFRVIKKTALQKVLEIPESTGNVTALMIWCGISYSTLDLRRDSRFAGSSGYSFSKMFKIAFNRIFSYSLAPIKVLFYLGIILSFTGGALSIYLIISYITTDVLSGWTSISVAMSLLFGLNFLFLSIIAEYLSRIYTETRGQPKYIIQSIEQLKDD